MSLETKAWLGWKRIVVAFIYVHYFLYSNQSLRFFMQRERETEIGKGKERERKKDTKAHAH